MLRYPLYVVLTCSVLAHGCADEGDGIERTADFANMNNAQLRLVIEQSSGTAAVGAYWAMIVGEIDSVQSGNTCPVRSYGGDSMTLTASGCKAPRSGTVYSGRVVATNAVTLRDLASDPHYDTGKPTSVVFERFNINSPVTGALSVDGRFDQSSPDATRYQSHSKLAVTSGAARTTEDLAVSCDGRDESNFSCTIDRGVLFVDGLGRYTAAGSFGRTAGEPYGTLDLLGLQPLHLELGAGPCHKFWIGDGSDHGEICWDED